MITDEEAKQNIAANIQAMLNAKGLSQADLARITHENAMRVSFVVRGIKIPSASFLNRIAEALNCKMEDIMKPPGKKLSRAS